MRVRIVRPPTESSIDGLRLDHFWVGRCYEVSATLGAVLVAEGWAVPVGDDESDEDCTAVQTADLRARLSNFSERPRRRERRIARFPVDWTAAFAHDWSDRRGRKRPAR